MLLRLICLLLAIRAEGAGRATYSAEDFERYLRGPRQDSDA